MTKTSRTSTMQRGRKKVSVKTQPVSTSPKISVLFAVTLLLMAKETPCNVTAVIYGRTDTARGCQLLNFKLLMERQRHIFVCSVLRRFTKKQLLNYNKQSLH